jgi:exonuclease III
VKFGVNGLQSNNARAITIKFDSYALVAAYSPCTGYDESKMSTRKIFDKALMKHLEYFREEEHCPIVLAGDLNVCPRLLDFHPMAFLQCAKLKENSTIKDDPGCSVQEISMYHEIVRRMKGYNVWEKLHPNSDKGMTWHSTIDRATRNYTTGLRIDHFVVAKEMMSGIHKWQVKDIHVFQGVGSSDHCPLVLRFEKRNPQTEAHKTELRS